MLHELTKTREAQCATNSYLCKKKESVQLSHVIPGNTVTVASFQEAQIELKLMEFGINIGSQITVERIAPFGGPVLIQTQNGKIALRQEEAATLTVTQD